MGVFFPVSINCNLLVSVGPAVVRIYYDSLIVGGLVVAYSKPAKLAITMLAFVGSAMYVSICCPSYIGLLVSLI